MDKQIITFSANEQHLHKTGGLDIYASKTVSYIEAHFDLGQNWSGYDSIEAVWWNDRTRPIRTVLDTEGICIAPPEVLTKKGEVYVNLVGVISSGNTLTDRLTTHPITALTNKFNAQLGEGTTTPLTPSEYEQFVATVKADADRAEDAKDSARVYAGNALSSAQNALASETNASTSETNAHTSEVNARASELNAETYKDQAQTYAQNADISATNAENAKDEAIDARDEIRNMSATATTLPAGSNATASYSGGVLSLGIPKGDKGDRGQQGIQGETGATPNFAIGTVETLEPTEDATATITGTAENPVLNLGIPQGEVGEVSYADLKSLLPMDTASGAIVSITDGQSVIPVDSLKVSLEPIQDLHGYDKPWSGGAGTNKWDEEWELGSYGSDGLPVTSTDKIRTKNRIEVEPSTAYYFKNGGSGNLIIFWYDDSDTVISFEGTNNAVKTSPANAKYLRFRTNNYGTTYGNDIAINYPSTVTTYSPYSNICPISGHTEVDTHRTGVNVWDEEWENGLLQSDGTIGVGSCVVSKNFIPVIAGQTYCLSWSNIEGLGRGAFYDSDKNLIQFYGDFPTSATLENGRRKGTFTVPSNATYLKFCTNGSYVGSYRNDISINYPSTDHDYHAYDGNTYTTDLGRTVYGGTLDIVSGELVVDRAMVDLGTLTWIRGNRNNSDTGYTFYSYGISSIAKVGDIVCSALEKNPNYNRPWEELEVGQIRYGSLTGATLIACSTDTTASDFKSAMSGVQLCYELATPTTIQLTPTEVKLLLGNNTIWSDGDVAIVYSADVTKWIEKQLS